MEDDKSTELFPKTEQVKQQEDFNKRATSAQEEIKAILDNYQVGIIGRIDYQPDGLSAKPAYVDLKKWDTSSSSSE